LCTISQSYQKIQKLTSSVMNKDAEYAAEMFYPNSIQQTWLCIWQHPSFLQISWTRHKEISMPSKPPNLLTQNGNHYTLIQFISYQIEYKIRRSLRKEGLPVSFINPKRWNKPSLATPKTYPSWQTALSQTPTCAYGGIPCTMSPAGDARVTNSTAEVPCIMKDVKVLLTTESATVLISK